MNSIVKTISKQCLTREEAVKSLEELRSRAEESFFGKGALSEEEKEILKGLDKTNLGDSFGAAEKELDKLPELIIYTALSLPGTEREKLGKKARELFGEELFLDFRVDEKLIGGAALAFDGQYKDYSIQARLAEKQEEIRSIYHQLLVKKDGKN